MSEIIQTSERGEWTSASNAHADSLCPGRHLMQKGQPDNKSDWSESGTRIHAALAVETDTASLKLDVSEHDVFESCRKIEQAQVARTFGPAPEGINKPWVIVRREQRLWSPIGGAWEGKPRHSGQPDVVYYCPSQEMALVCEFKTLPGELPESSRNMQLRDQAVLVAANNPKVKRVIVCVIQPLVTHTPELIGYELEDLIRAANEMLARVVRSNDPTSPRVAGEVQCKYCRACKVCPEYNRWAGAMVPGMLSLLDVPVADWTPDQRTLFCDKAGVAEKWLTDTWDAMKALATADPAAIPGYAMVPGKVNHPISDPQAAFTRAVELGVKPEKFMGCVKVGKEKLEEAVGVAIRAKGKALKETMGKLLEGITEEKQNAPSLKKVQP